MMIFNSVICFVCAAAGFIQLRSELALMQTLDISPQWLQEPLLTHLFYLLTFVLLFVHGIMFWIAESTPILTHHKAAAPVMVQPIPAQPIPAQPVMTQPVAAQPETCGPLAALKQQYEAGEITEQAYNAIKSELEKNL